MKHTKQLPMRSLKNTLQVFSKNTKGRHNCNDVSTLKENLYQQVVVNYFNAPQMQNNKFDNYADLTLAIVQMIIQHDLESLSIFTQHFNFEHCAACPSIKYLVESGIINRSQSLMVIGRIIDLLSKYFKCQRQLA